MKIAIEHELVVPRRMMLSEIVGHVELAFSPDDLKMILVDAVENPINTHIEGF